MMIYGLKVETLQMHWGNENPGKAIRVHMDSDDKMPIDELLTVSKRRPQIRAPF